LREAPDVILIGEIRDAATMQHAIAYAETGHLCLSTLHANNANQALDRIVNFFPDSAHKQIHNDLSLNLKAVVSQRLIPTVDGGRRAAIELLMQTAYTAELIQNTGEHPAIIKDRVTSPGGTTIAGLEALEAHGLRAALMAAVEAATVRSIQLGAG